MKKLISLFLLPLLAFAAPTQPITNGVVPSGGTLTIQSGGTITAAAGSTVTGFGGGGSPAGSTGDLQINSAGSFGALTPGTGVSTFLATPSSANLASAVTGETGSGALVFATTPTLVTPILGIAAATSINKVAITTPATSATLTILNGKTLTANNSLTLAGTDSTTQTFPTTSATIARTDAGQTFAGSEIFSGTITGTAAFPQVTLGVNTTTKGGIKMFGNTSGDVTISPLAVAGTATALTFPATSGGLIASVTAIGTVTGTPSSSNFLRGDGTWATPAGSGTVTTSGTITVGALLTAQASTAIQTPSSTATMDSSGNISTPGTLTVGNAATTAGAVALTQGTTQSAGTTNITIQAPAAVTSYIRTLPGAAATGFYLGTNSAGTVTDTQVAANGTGNVLLSAGTAAIASAKTLTVNNSLTLAGTDGTTMTFPSTTATIARTDAANTFTGVQTMTSPAFTTSITTASTSFTALAGATTLLTFGGTGASASTFFPSTLDTTSSITGAIRTSGGISAAKALNIGTTITGGGNLTIGTSNSATVGTIELGAASDTTLARSAAGVMSVEGNIVSMVGPRITAITSSATPTFDIRTCDVVNITALATAITSMTSSMTITGVQDFQQLEFRILDNGTARAITWGANFASGMATLPTTTVLGKALCVYTEYDAVQAKFMCQSVGSYP